MDYTIDRSNVGVSIRCIVLVYLTLVAKTNVVITRCDISRDIKSHVEYFSAVGISIDRLCVLQCAEIQTRQIIVDARDLGVSKTS